MFPLVCYISTKLGSLTRKINIHSLQEKPVFMHNKRLQKRKKKPTHFSVMTTIWSFPGSARKDALIELAHKCQSCKFVRSWVTQTFNKITKCTSQHPWNELYALVQHSTRVMHVKHMPICISFPDTILTNFPKTKIIQLTGQVLSWQKAVQLSWLQTQTAWFPTKSPVTAQKLSFSILWVQ